ncbi:hypothetical protein VPH35_028014 [Triticum aestivum]
MLVYTGLVQVVLWFGAMPLGFLPPVLASSCRWLPFLSSSSSPWWRKGGGAGSGEIPLNKLAGLSDLELKLLLPYFSSSCHGGGLEEEEERGFGCSILSACPWSPSSAANGWGSWCREHQEFLATAPLYLLVERRPLGVLATTSGSCISSWPPSHMGGSLSGSLSWYFHGLPPVVCRRCCSHSFTPSGFVPGGGGIGPGSKTAKRTRLLFIFVVWGPICKMSGLGCNFLFLLGLSVICCMLI